MTLLILPKPLPSVPLGALLTHPLSANAPSLKPSISPPSKSTTKSSFSDTITHDASGRFTSSAYIARLQGQAYYSHEDLVALHAEEMEHASLEDPVGYFEELIEAESTRTFFTKMAAQKEDVYLVTGLQKLRNPTFTPAVVEHGILTEKSTKRLPLRRKDSFSPPPSPPASNTAETEEEEQDVTAALSLLKLRVRIGDKEEPHSVCDLQYTWKYFDLEGEKQLCVGTGGLLREGEVRDLAGMERESVEEKEGEVEWDDDEGLGGF